MHPASSGAVNATNSAESVTPEPLARHEAQTAGDLKTAFQEQPESADDSTGNHAPIEPIDIAVAGAAQHAVGRDKDLRSSTATRRKVQRPGTRGVLPILIILVLFTLLVGWLIFRPGLDDMRAWQEQAGNWWQSIVAPGQPATEVGRPPAMYPDTTQTDAKPEANTRAESESELRFDPQAEPEPEAEPEVLLDPKPGVEPESEADSLPEPAPKSESTYATESGRDAAPQTLIESEPPELSSRTVQYSNPTPETSASAKGLAIPSNLQISFGFDSAMLSERAKDALDEFAEAIKSAGPNSVKVTGYADGLGDPDYNVGLSRRRAEAAAQYLVERGVDAGVLVVTSQGAHGGADQATSENIVAQTIRRRIVRLEAQVNDLAP